MSNNSVTSSYNPRPCQNNNNIYSVYLYNRFQKRHIVPDYVKTPKQWNTYMERFITCKPPLQSFIRKADEERVKNICKGSGWHVRGNLCVSNSRMMVYEVTVKRNCQVKPPGKGTKYLTVACDKIGNCCLPVHYEKTKYQLLILNT
ncbi:hypothetical protein PAMP_015900 [Pampus punctatissimus]